MSAARSKRKAVVSSDESEVSSDEACSSQSLTKKGGRKKKCPKRESTESSESNLSQQPDFVYSLTMRDEAEVGIIESVHLQNFMCHKNLEWNLGPSTNFVIGPNGSGKSALLTAIIAGLGGKAALTGRGANIKGLVNSGTTNSKPSAAKVTIQLRNRGPDAYKHDKYGDSIIIERRIASGDSGGSNSYFLKSAEKKIISKKREELDHVLDHFNIQVDNPVAVLNQEVSKRFLFSNSPSDKYKFFLRATQLDQMENDYDRAFISQSHAEMYLKQKKETLPQLEKEVEELEKKYKAFTSVDVLEEKIKNLKNELAWSFVQENEKKLEAPLKELKMEEARTPKFIQKLEDAENQLKTVTAAHEDIQEKIKALAVECSPVEAQFKKIEEKLNESKKGVKKTEAELMKIMKELKSLEKDKQQIEQRITDIRNSNDQNSERERLARLDRIQHLTNRLQELDAQRRTTQHSLEQFNGAVSYAKQQKERLLSEQVELRGELQRMQKQLNNLKESRTNRLTRFGTWVPELVQKIDDAVRRGVFHKKPVGPIGAHISLKDHRWALAVEKCLGGLIHAFCVNDYDDEKQLKTLLRQTLPRDANAPMVITGKFRPNVFDVSAHQAQSSRYLTVLDVLDIENPVIANCLINQREVERVILIESDVEARQVMSSDHPPRNASLSYSLDGTRTYPSPNYRVYSCFQASANYLTTSVEEQISELESNVNQKRAEMDRLTPEMHTYDSDISSNQAEARKCQMQLSRIGVDSGKMNLELNELKNIEDPVPQDVAALEEEIEQLDVQIGALQNKKMEIELKVGEAKEERAKAERDFAQHDEQRKSIVERSETLQEEMQKIEDDIRKAREHKKHFESKLREHRADIAKKQEIVEQLKKSIEGDIVKATEICPSRIRTKRSSQNLESEIIQIKKQIQHAMKVTGDRDAITRSYNEKQNSYKNILRECQQYEQFLKLLKTSLEMRRKQFQKFLRMISYRVSLMFTQMLDKRGYKGLITINHKDQQIDMQVQPHSGKKGAELADVRSLSGGERSFTTVCFICSLWDTMESPFRCLDEFDVFMDMVNRNQSMNLMLDIATKHSAKQFVFITPQNMRELVKDNRNIRIYEMKKPERTGRENNAMTDNPAENENSE